MKVFRVEELKPYQQDMILEEMKGKTKFTFEYLSNY